VADDTRDIRCGEIREYRDGDSAHSGHTEVRHPQLACFQPGSRRVAVAHASLHEKRRDVLGSSPELRICQRLTINHGERGTIGESPGGLLKRRAQGQVLIKHGSHGEW